MPPDFSSTTWKSYQSFLVFILIIPDHLQNLPRYQHVKKRKDEESSLLNDCLHEKVEKYFRRNTIYLKRNHDFFFRKQQWKQQFCKQHRSLASNFQCHSALRCSYTEFKKKFELAIDYVTFFKKKFNNALLLLCKRLSNPFQITAYDL